MIKLTLCYTLLLLLFFLLFGTGPVIDCLFFLLNSYSCLPSVLIKNFIKLGYTFSVKGGKLFFVHPNLAFVRIYLEAKSWHTFLRQHYYHV